MSHLILIRGLPGVGKTTIANLISSLALSADLYFHKDQNERNPYNFDPSLLGDAHAWCLEQTKIAIEKMRWDVVVANTFTQRWEMQPYFDLNAERVSVLDMFDGGLTDEQLAARNSHGVPAAAIKRMRDRYELDWSGLWKNG